MKNIKKINKILLTISGMAGLAFIGLSIYVGTTMDQKSTTESEKDNEVETIKSPIKPELNKNLIAFFEHPIDLQEFKKETKGDVTTNVTEAMEYYFSPESEDSIYYSYNIIDGNIETKEGNTIVVFKNEANKHTYDEKNEQLIELRILRKDPALGRANLVGLSRAELEFKFGKMYQDIGSHLVFTHKNKILLIELNSSKVTSYSYINLNTNTINNNLIKQIIK